MSSTRATADDMEQVSGAAAPSEQAVEQAPCYSKPNAFTELMKPKRKWSSLSADTPTKRTMAFGRDGLALYAQDPDSYPDRVLETTDKFVVIKDAFPKSVIHWLILPRDPKKMVQRPQEAFDDLDFLEDCRRMEEDIRTKAASELGRRLRKHSKTEEARTQAMESEELVYEPPEGRDWGKEIKSGIHANPSMNHLHIHILSRDMAGEYLKKTNHYQSFNTDFFVGLDKFPLPKDDPLRNYKHFPPDMQCWRCGKSFGNKISKLKEHLAEEFDEWKKE